MTDSLLFQYYSMRDRGWLAESPKQGAYTIFNLTMYSSGDSEATVTTLHEPIVFRPKKVIDEAFHDQLLDSEPYTGDEAEALMLQATELKKINEFEQEQNKQRSLRRSRSVIRKKIIEGNLDHFLTLTYQENKQDVAECWKDWKKFIRSVQKKYPSLKYLVIVERQKRGAVHFHVAVHGFMHVQSVRRSWLDVVGKGNIDIKRRRDGQSMHRLSKYMTKYLTKQYDELESFKNMYRCSKNIRLKQLKFYFPEEFACSRIAEIDRALKLFIRDIKQFWQDSNGLFSCQWASSLAP